MITLCVTTFNRQDMLPRCLESAMAGTVTPDKLVIIDQSGKLLMDVRLNIHRTVSVVDLGTKRGCEAAAINYYLTEVPEERIIAHDDVVFGPDSIKQLVETPGAFLIDAQQGVVVYRDACVKAVGLYDETISPNFYRYVDVDYEDRLALAGIEPTVVDCGVLHVRDGVMRGCSSEELIEHDRKVAIAADNYRRKWNRELTPSALGSQSTIGRSLWRKAQS